MIQHYVYNYINHEIKNTDFPFFKIFATHPDESLLKDCETFCLFWFNFGEMGSKKWWQEVFSITGHRYTRQIHTKAPLDETPKCQNSISYQAKCVQALDKWLNRILDPKIKQDSFNVKMGAKSKMRQVQDSNTLDLVTMTTHFYHEAYHWNCLPGSLRIVSVGYFPKWLCSNCTRNYFCQQRSH